ncbi:hypothetical protein GQ53DRAFT_640953 [Thozetella sp. PMI_491]|nr:hypothetical protein GQ53DRAFT_640953 [Thozetella sp. PMI_491]
MIPVSECISQWKWNWFNSQRPLIDFHIFDSASRGFFGSITLLRLLKWNHFATIGAIVSILCVATTPVTQLLIQLPDRLVPVFGDSITASSAAIMHYRSQIGVISLDLYDYISTGLVHSSSSSIPHKPPSCPSGTCSWERFQSIGICVTTANITDHLQVSQVPFSTSDDWTTWIPELDTNPLALNGTLAYNVSFPDDGNYFVTPVSYVVYSAFLAHSIAFSKDTHLEAAKIAGYKVAWGTSGDVTYNGHNATRPDPWQFQAVEVLYYACINTYEIRVENGTPSTNKSSSYDTIALPADGDAKIVINCSSPLSQGRTQASRCSESTTSSDHAVMVFRGSGDAPAGNSGANFTANLRSLAVVGLEIIEQSTGFWAFDGRDKFLMAGNQGLPIIADAVYGYIQNPSGNQQSPLSMGSSDDQVLRLRTATENVAVSITNGYVVTL